MITLILYLCLHHASAVTMEEDANISVNSPPSDSFMSLKVGMNDPSNDAASLCPPQRVYIPQKASTVSLSHYLS